MCTPLLHRCLETAWLVHAPDKGLSCTLPVLVTVLTCSSAAVLLCQSLRITRYTTPFRFLVYSAPSQYRYPYTYRMTVSCTSFKMLYEKD